MYFMNKNNNFLKTKVVTKKIYLINILIISILFDKKHDKNV